MKDITRFDYLQHRPFLVIDILLTPGYKVRTERKGWMKDKENVEHTEHPSVVSRISYKIMCRATVIIDVIQDKLVKNRFRLSTEVDPVEFDKEVFKHYKEKYMDKIIQAKMQHNAYHRS